MKLIQWIVNIFKKDHAKLSSEAINAFDTILKKLQDINRSAAQKSAENANKVAELTAHNKELADTIQKNSTITRNISVMLGSDGEIPTKEV